jgi:hypothetical protein
VDSSGDVPNRVAELGADPGHAPAGSGLLSGRSGRSTRSGALVAGA